MNDTTTLNATKCLVNAVDEAVKLPDAAENLISWLEAECYGGDCTEMQKEEQEVIDALIFLMDCARRDYEKYNANFSASDVAELLVDLKRASYSMDKKINEFLERERG